MTAKKPSLATYRIPKTKVPLDEYELTAHFLNEAAVISPGVMFTSEEIFQYTHRGEPFDAAIVEAIVKSRQKAYELLESKYGRGFVFHRGIGCRATVDDDDRQKHCVARRRKRAHASTVRYQSEVNAVNPNNLSDPDLKMEHQRDLVALKAIVGTGIAALLKR